MEVHQIYFEAKKAALKESLASHEKTMRSMPRAIKCSVTSSLVLR